jgi:hypothetical protein
MPIFTDLEEPNVVNPFLVDLLVVRDNRPISPNAEKILLKLKPIFVTYDIFEYLFFKKHRGKYGRVKLTFLDSLLAKIKPKLIRSLHCHTNSSCKSISLSREILELTIDENKSMSVKGLTHSEFLKVADSPDDTFVRATVHLGISSINVNLTIEFVFKIEAMPCMTPFESDDLFRSELCLSTV